MQPGCHTNSNGRVRRSDTSDRRKPNRIFRLALLFAILMSMVDTQSHAAEATAASKPAARRPKELTPEAASLLKQAQTAFQTGHGAEAIALASKAITLEPDNPRCYFIRAKIHELQQESAEAIKDYDKVEALDSTAVDIFQFRGGEYFKLAQIEKAIRDFDRYLSLRPDQAPHHWQRGIALYYADRFEDGRKQFEVHQTVNASDVENAAWHFLCNARANGVARAREGLIAIRDDGRPAMMDVFALFQGKLKPEELLATVEKMPQGQKRKQAEFYSALYVGLYHEAVGENDKAKPQLIRAAALSKDFGYMGDVARVHVALRFGGGNQPAK